MEHHLTVSPERTGLELDEFLCLLFPLLSKGFLRRQVRDGRVLVDGSPVQPSQRLRIDQVVSIGFDAGSALPTAPAAPPLELEVLYEDEATLVVDKPADLAVEPERWARGEGCVSGALLELALRRSGLERGAASAPATGLDFRPRLVHRIDKDTSGCLLVAKDIETERRLREAFAQGAVRKSYLALVEGEHPAPDGEEDRLDFALAPDRRKSGRMRVARSGKESCTLVSVAQRFRGYTLLRCRPLTGRTHQIRVHLAAAGFPLLIDSAYGRRAEILLSELKRGYRPKRGRPELPLMSRLTLHAEAIEFPGADGESVRVDAELHRDMRRLLTQLLKVRPHRR